MCAVNIYKKIRLSSKKDRFTSNYANYWVEIGWVNPSTLFGTFEAFRRTPLQGGTWENKAMVAHMGQQARHRDHEG
jgi:hypothetical protein